MPSAGWPSTTPSSSGSRRWPTPCAAASRSRSKPPTRSAASNAKISSSRTWILAGLKPQNNDAHPEKPSPGSTPVDRGTQPPSIWNRPPKPRAGDSAIATIIKRRARVLAMVMAGGKGERLHPLTRDRSKPAVPFAGRYRIVDFVLSNFVNSDVLSLYVLVQYKSQSLIEHVRLSWRTTGIVPDYFVTVVPPQMRFGPAWYRGTADAVLQNLNLVDDFHPDVVAIFGSDHVYRMDINQMLIFHEESGADVTVAARPVPRADATSFGVLAVDRHGKVVNFVEKPTEP